MNAALAHLSNIRGAVASLVIAFVVVSAITNTMLAYLGGIEFQSPLLYTLLAVTTATLVVGFLTAGIAASASEHSADQVRRTATASFVFANAAGTLTALIGHLSQTWEMGSRNYSIGSHDGATLVLGLLNLDPKTFFTAYLAVTAIIATLAFPLIIWGAHLIVGKRIATKTELNSVGAISLLLLIFGLMIGTEWGAVDADTRQAMTAYGLGLRIAMLFVIFLCFGVYSILLVFSLSRFAALFSSSALRIGAKVAVQDIWPIVIRVIAEFGYGLLFAAGSVMVLFVVWYYGTQYLQTLDFLPQELRKRLIEAFAYGVLTAAVIAFWAYAGSAAVIALSAFGPSVARLGRDFLALLFTGLFYLLKLVLAVCAFLLALAAQAANAATIGIQRTHQSLLSYWHSIRPKAKEAPPKEAKPPETVSVKRPSKPAPSWSQVAPRSSWPKLDFNSLRVLVVGLFLSGVVLLACYVVFRALTAVFSVSPGSQETGIEEESVDEESLPPGFERADPRPISVCQAVPGSLQWYVEREDTLEFSLDDCLLPPEVRQSNDGALVVVGVASVGGVESEEVARAVRRGKAIAQWASFQIPDTVPVYVLNLGMARREDAFAFGWELFGRVTGERPVLALHITPFPEGTIVPLSTIVDELGASLGASAALDHFTHCELYTFERNAPIGGELQPVQEFDCRAPE